MALAADSELMVTQRADVGRHYLGRKSMNRDIFPGRINKSKN